MQPVRQQTLGLILIALLILIFTLVRFGRVFHWSVR
jgi:cell division protein FtsB